jgi:outer membrane protein OmpA-like peptidoglycan-associated protein
MKKINLNVVFRYFLLPELPLLCLSVSLSSLVLLSACTMHHRIPADRLVTGLQDTPIQIVERNNELILILPAASTFQPGGTKLLPGSYPLLIKIADRLLKDYPDARIKVVAYTDSSGTATRNRDLSIIRAHAVAGYLHYRGISRDRLGEAGFGDSHPVASNATPEGRAKNRRIEIYLD